MILLRHPLNLADLLNIILFFFSHSQTPFLAPLNSISLHKTTTFPKSSPLHSYPSPTSATPSPPSLQWLVGQRKSFAFIGWPI